MMVAYHLMFDLSYFGVARIPLGSLPLVLFQRSIGALFLLLVGVSLSISESRNRRGYPHHAKRGLMLSAVALLITLATWVFPHEGFITFGIIHLIALSTFIAPIFFGLGRTNILAGMAVIAAGLIFGGTQVANQYAFWLGFPYQGYTALDYYPILPWFGMVLIGIGAGRILYPEGKSRFRLNGTPIADRLALAGRNSLLIYLAHQALLVPLVLAIRLLM